MLCEVATSLVHYIFYNNEFIYIYCTTTAVTEEEREEDQIDALAAEQVNIVAVCPALCNVLFFASILFYTGAAA